MSTINDIPGRWGWSVQSGARSTNSRINNRVCATLLAGFILFAGGAKAQVPTNVLVNPGAETGNLTGWTKSLTGYIDVLSTNNTINGAGTGYVLAHSGEYVFRLFDTTGAEGEGTASIYQDFPADPGSQWSASCYAIEYATNYPSSGIAYMNVAFYDISNNVLSDTNIPAAPWGVYGSDILDPVGGGSTPYIILAPEATNATGWLYLPATNFYYGYSLPAGVTVPPNPPPAGILVESGNEYPESTNLIAPPGTVKVRYQLEYDNGADTGGAVYFDDCVLEKLNQTDPDITGQSGPVTVLAGGAASFTVGYATAYVGEKVTFQWQKNGTNLPAAGGGDINGNTTGQTLTITNCQAVDQGLYDVVVTDKNTHVSPTITNSIMSVPVALTVQTLSPLQKVNALGVNAGFESNPVWSPWNIFNGCYFATAASTYDGVTPVNVFDGTTCAEVGANGDRDNGFWQAPSTTALPFGSLPIAPGTWWKAAGWAYISSSNDMTAGNTCRLQIWFKDNTGTTVPGTSTYESYKLYGLAYTNANMQYVCIDASSPQDGQTLYHTFLPRDQWCFLQVSNVVDNNGIGLEDDIPYNTLPLGIFMVPTNTSPAVAEINFQVYEYCPQSTDVDVDDGQPGPTGGYLGNATDAVYWDDLELIQVLPVTNLKASVSGNTMNLSFSAQAGLDYLVLYKTNLTDATWNELTDVAAPWSWQTNVLSVGISTNVTVSDSLTAHSRFYQVQVH